MAVELGAPERDQLLPNNGGPAHAVEAPEQLVMRGDGTSAPNGCSCTVKEALETAASWMMSALMALIMIPLGLPAALIVFTLAGMGQVYQACGGSQKDWSLFVVGADRPSDVSEECNREVAGKSEAIRGKGPWPNLVYYVQNNHPVFSLFCCAPGHPFSPVERFGLLVLLGSFSYFMAGIKAKMGSYDQHHHAHWNNMELSWLLKSYSLVCIALPSFLLESLLKYFALLDYKYILNKYDYFSQTRTERCIAFAKQFCIERSLGIPRPPKKPRSGKGGFSSIFDCDCCRACCETIKLCETCANNCEDGQTQAVNSIFATLFAGIALTASCLFIFFGVRLDVESSEDVWRAFGIGLGANFFCLWFVIAIAKFLVKWQYQHWHGRRFVLFRVTIPPEPELWTELRHFFSSVDFDKDGFFSREDAKTMVTRYLAQDLCEDGWQKLLEELDSDHDGKISLSEFEALRTDFATKTSWWLPGSSHDAVQRSGNV